MATITTIQKLARNVRTVDVGNFSIDDKPMLPAAAQNDRLVLFTFPCDMRLNSAHLRQGAGLGGATTIKLQRNRAGVYTDLTANTTAATAGVVNSAGLLPLDVAAGDTVEVLISGGALTSGQVEYDLVGRRA